MRTTLPARSETRTISVAAPPDAVLDLVSDASRLPDWAPRFAAAVRPDGDAWIVDDGERRLRVVLRLSREHGTLDVLAADDPRSSAFTRAVPNGGGTEFVFTLCFPGGTDEETIARRMAIVEEELRAVRRLCERTTGPRS